MAGDNLAMLSELVIDITVLDTGVELLIEVEGGSGTVTMLAEIAIVVGSVGYSAL